MRFAVGTIREREFPLEEVILERHNGKNLHMSHMSTSKLILFEDITMGSGKALGERS